MNYRKMEKNLDRAYEEIGKQAGNIENAMAEHLYRGMMSAVWTMGLFVRENEGKHTIIAPTFVQIYKNEDEACDCSLCEISAKCALKDESDRLPDPQDPTSIGRCPKLT